MTPSQAYRAALEAAAKVAKNAWLTTRYGSIADADAMNAMCEELAAAIRALPVPPYRIEQTAEEDYPFSDASLFDGCVIGVPNDAGDMVLVPREPTNAME